MRLVLGDGKRKAAGDAAESASDDAEGAAEEVGEDRGGAGVGQAGEDASNAEQALEVEGKGGETGDDLALLNDVGGSGGGEGQGGEGEDHGELHFESGGWELKLESLVV